MQGIETQVVKCSECRYMVVGDLFAIWAQSSPPSSCVCVLTIPMCLHSITMWLHSLHIPTWFPVRLPITPIYLHSLHYLHGLNSMCRWPFCTKGSVLTTMHLHFTIWFPVWVSTTAVYLHSLCFIVWVQFPTWVTFLHKGHYLHHHVPTFTAFHCVGFNSLYGSPPFPCTYIHWMGSIHCIGGLFALRAKSSPPCTCTWVLTTPIYLHSITMLLQSLHFLVWFPVWSTTTIYLHSLHSLHGLYSLHGWPFCTKGQEQDVLAFSN